jgi:hypothetical protein
MPICLKTLNNLQSRAKCPGMLQLKHITILSLRRACSGVNAGAGVGVLLTDDVMGNSGYRPRRDTCDLR